MRFVEVDGSFGEGGGQIVRTAAGMSAATMIPIRIKNIRAKRPKPGLSYQHLHAVRAIQLLTKAEVEGLKLSSKEITFIPSKINGGDYKVEIGTAGSISLVLQTFLIPALFSQKELELEISGGTDVPMSPPIDYIKNVFLRLLRLMGADADIAIERRGHYPRGGGKVVLRVFPSDVKGLNIGARGKLKEIKGLSHCTNLPSHVAERQRASALELIQEKVKMDAIIETEVGRGYGEGSGIVLWAEYDHTTIGASALGKRGKRAEKVGREAAYNLLNEIAGGSTVDSHMGDQLLPYIALAEGPSSYICRLSSHTKTNIYTIERIVDRKFDLSPAKDGLSRIASVGQKGN